MGQTGLFFLTRCTDSSLTDYFCILGYSCNYVYKSVFILIFTLLISCIILPLLDS